ncbi:MAG: hypothetical protein ACRDSQ_30525, partial [Actinokineospora sp.]
IIPPGHVSFGGRVETRPARSTPSWQAHHGPHGRSSQREIAAAVPGAQHRSLPGQTHLIKAKVLAPVLADYFSAAITHEPRS